MQSGKHLRLIDVALGLKRDNRFDLIKIIVKKTDINDLIDLKMRPQFCPTSSIYLQSAEIVHQ